MSTHHPVKPDGGATRGRILDAAKHVMCTLGLTRTTTREIARAAGYSEATLYKHFRAKEELFLSVLAERMPSFIDTMKGLPGRAGQATVHAILCETARAALGFFAEVYPMGSALFAEPELLAAHQEALRQRGGGPHLANHQLAAYLRAEQHLGRVAAEVDADAAAALLLGACLQHAFLTHFTEPAMHQPPEQLAETLVSTLLRELQP